MNASSLLMIVMQMQLAQIAKDHIRVNVILGITGMELGVEVRTYR